MDFGKKVRQGVEEKPIVAPMFTPTKQPQTAPAEQPVPGFAPDFTPVPVAPVRRQGDATGEAAWRRILGAS